MQDSGTFVTGQEVGSEVEGFWFRLPPALVVTVETFPAASLHLIKLPQRMESAALLAEPFLFTPDGDNRGLGVELTDSMASVILPAKTEVCLATLNQA